MTDAGGVVAATDWRGLRVLIVDDNVNFRRITRGILESAEVTDIEEAENGAEALEALRDFTADLVLCDWRMEEMDGIEFAQQLRGGGGENAGVPLILLTGFGGRDFRERAIAAGVTDFLEKPVTAAGLLQTLGRVLGGR